MGWAEAGLLPKDFRITVTLSPAAMVWVVRGMVNVVLLRVQDGIVVALAMES